MTLKKASNFNVQYSKGKSSQGVYGNIAPVMTLMTMMKLFSYDTFLQV